ncbi:MAG: recombinase family protein [Candidatus Omnitrophica bacterium]|nr:recombinase family protein [Candidatus Omnitrophota bacterium]
MTNPFYLSLFEYKGEIFQGKHPPIIEKDLFDKVQEILKFRSRPSLIKKHYFVFRGLISCAERGRQITAEIQKGHRYYHCGKKRDLCPQSRVFIREENLAQQIKEAILKVALDDRAFSYMMDELNREITLANAEKVHNRVSAEIKNQEIEEQLKRLLNLLVRRVISEEEYKREKAEFVNKKFDNLDGDNPDWDWHKRFKNFLTLAH